MNSKKNPKEEPKIQLNYWLKKMKQTTYISKVEHIIKKATFNEPYIVENRKIAVMNQYSRTGPSSFFRLSVFIELIWIKRCQYLFLIVFDERYCILSISFDNICF